MSESFEILLNNDTARSYINSILQHLKELNLPLPLNPVLTLEEMEKNGSELGIYLGCLKQFVLSNRPSIRKLKMATIKTISIGPSGKKVLIAPKV